MKAPSKGIYGNARNITLKSPFSESQHGVNATPRFIYLAVFAPPLQICEILRNTPENSNLNSRLRSTKVIELGVDRKRICDFQLVTFNVSPTVSLILILQLENWSFPTTPLFGDSQTHLCQLAKGGGLA